MAAPTLSQVIGVLAAVVFAGMVFLMQQTPPSEDSELYRYSSRALMTLLYVFLSLVIAAFFYGVVSGEENCRRAFGEGAVGGALFAGSVVGIFLSISWLFAAQRIGGPYVIWAKILMFLAGATAWTFTALTVMDAAQIIETAQQGFRRSGVFWWGILPFALPLATIVGLRAVGKWREELRRHAALAFEIMLGSLVVSLFGAVIAFSVISLQPSLRTFAIEWRIAIAIISAVNLCFYFANMMIIRRAPVRPPSVPEAADRPRPLANAEPLVTITINFGRRRQR
jgi:hypothetical protein